MSPLNDLQLDRLIDDVVAGIANPAAPTHLEHRLKQRSRTMTLTPATALPSNVLAFHSLGRTGGRGISRGALAVAATINIAAMLLIALQVRTHLAQPTLRITQASIQVPPPPLPPARTLAGGGGGNPGTTPVTKGNLPKFAIQQINPPKAPPLEQPRIHIDPTVDVQPDLHMTRTDLPNLGMPNSPLAGTSLGNGRGTGIGSGIGGGVGPGSGGNMGGSIRRIGGGVSAPVVLFAPEPEFSEEARRAKVSGNVLVALQVDAQGRPTHVRILRGIGLGLDQKAIDAVSQYKFKPALENGRPVPVEMNVEVNFQIF